MKTLSFNEFYNLYFLKHLADTPVRKETRHGGYELHYENGDTYIEKVSLKPGRTPDGQGRYMSDDFDYTSTMNGMLITR